MKLSSLRVVFLSSLLLTGAARPTGPNRAIRRVGGEFLVLLDVGCKRPVVAITNNADGSRGVTVGSQSVTVY
jgi:hypothetical protein